MPIPVEPGQKPPAWVDKTKAPITQPVKIDYSQSTRERSLWGHQMWRDQFKGAPTWVRGALRNPESLNIRGTNQYLVGDDQSRGYWDNPQRIVRYYNMIQNAPPDWQPPEWLNTEAIKQAYDWFGYRNNGQPWYAWNYLPTDDPASSFLSGLPKPPDDFLFPGEEAYRTPKTDITGSVVDPADQLFGKWDDLKPWQKLALTLLSPQPGLQGRPESSRIAASLGQAGLAALGGGAGGAMLGSVVPGVGTAAGGIAGALIAGVGTFYQAYTGTEVPVLSDILIAFNVPAMGVEIGAGLTGQAIHDESLNEIIENWPSAWRAGQLEYEQGFQNVLLNTLAGAYGEEKAPAGYTWQIQKGIAVPVKIQGRVGVDAMIEARERMANGESWELVYADMVDRFGYSGTVNDFIGQSLLDPLQVAPFAVGKIGGKIGDITGNVRLSEAFKATQGPIALDILPFGIQQLAEFVTGRSATRGPIATFEVYKNWIQAGFFPEGAKVKAAPDLSRIDKLIGGLTEEGKIRELEAAGIDSKGKGTFVRSLSNLTPESQAHGFVSLMADNLKALASIVAGDPTMSRLDKATGVINLYKQAAGLDPVTVGQAGADILGSPVTASVQGAVRSFMNSEVPRNMLAQWQSAQEPIQMLEVTAKVLGMETGRVLELIEMDPRSVAAELVAKAREQGNTGLVQAYERGALMPESLYDQLKQFTGPDGQPWNFHDWLARFNNALVDNASDYVIKRYGLKPDPAMNRFFGTMKSVQSLLLLDGSPWYIVNNGVNNAVTMAANGVFGALTPRQADAWIARFGIEPQRISEGFTPGAMEGGTSKIRDAGQAGDWIDKATRTINAGRNKLGWASRASRALEKMESKQAYVIGTRQMMDKLWKSGEGLKDMSPELRSRLDAAQPGLADKITRLVESSLSMEEIHQKMALGEAKLITDELINLAAKEQYPVHPELGTQILKDVIGEDLGRDLQNAKSPEEIRAVMNRIETHLQEYIDAKVAQDLTTRAAEVAEQVKAEGWAGAASLFVEQVKSYTQRWLDHFQEIEHLYEQIYSPEPKTYSEISALWAEFNRQDGERWRQVKNYDIASMAGIIKGLGITDAHSVEYLSLRMDLYKAWDEFYIGYELAPDGRHLTYAQANDLGIQTTHVDGKADLNRKFFNTDYDSKEARNLAWNRRNVEIAELSQKARQTERSIHNRMADVMADMWQKHTGQDPAPVKAWQQNVTGVLDEMSLEMDAFIDKLNKGDYTPDERRQMWQQHLDQAHKPLIMKLEQTDIEGSKSLADVPERPTKTTAPYPVTAAKAKVIADQILNAEANNQDAADAQFRGTMTRRSFKEQLRNSFKGVSGEEIDAVIAICDLHADRWAKANGLEVNLISREKWYANHLAKVVNGMDPTEGILLQNSGKMDISPENLLAKAKAQKDSYLATLKEVAQETGAHYKAEYEPFAIKSLERIKEKAAKTQIITDVLRSTMIIDKVSQYQDIIAAMEARGYFVWNDDFTNLYDDPSQGYKHIAIKFTMGEGDPVIKELQLLQPHIAEIKKQYGWDYYKIVREFEIDLDAGLITFEQAGDLYQAIKGRMDSLYLLAFSLDNPELLDPSVAKARISASFSGPDRFSKLANEILSTLRTPKSTSRRSSAAATSLESFLIKHTSDKSIIQQYAGEINRQPMPRVEQINSPYFKKWFRNSKVVDEAGNPMIVYHGTRADFTTFRFSKSDIGFHFGSYDQANVRLKYTANQFYKGAESVMPVYLSIDNPLRLRDLGYWDLPDMKNALRDLPEFAHVNWSEVKSLAEMRRIIQNAGYDGIVYRNRVEIDPGLIELNMRQGELGKAKDFSTNHKIQAEYEETSAEIKIYKEKYSADSYVVFDRSQVKSVHNKGSFAWGTGNILQQGGPSPYKPQPGLLELAAAYNIPTAFADGKINNHRILDIINTSGMVKDRGAYNKIGDVPVDFAADVFEARRIEKGEVIPGIQETVDLILEDARAAAEPGLSVDSVAKGGVQFLDDGRAVIKAMKAGDVSTIVHEVGHIFRRDLTGDDLDAIAQWGGLNDGQQLNELQRQFQDGTISKTNSSAYVKAEEQFARGFERYLAEDNAAIPPKMQSIFKRFTQWLARIYGKVFKGTPLDVDINTEINIDGKRIRIKDVYDRLLFEDQAGRALEEKSALLRTMPEGKTTRALGVSDPNIGYDLRWRIVDLSQLITSHDVEFKPVPEFPVELQARFRDRAENRSQVEGIAKNLNPDALILDTHQINTGAPIIGSDMAVESGNGRVMSLLMAKLVYPDTYKQYLAKLREHLAEFGISEEQFNRIDNPVLVRDHIGEYDRLAFIDDANAKVSLEFSSLENAVKEAGYIQDESLAKIKVGESQSIDEALRSKDNGFLIQEFFGRLQKNERANLLDSHGQITLDGILRIKRALFAKVFPGESGQRLLKIFVESIDPTMKNAEKAICQSLGPIMKADSLVRSGHRAPGLLIADDVTRAVDMMISIKKSKLSVDEYLSPGALFEQTPQEVSTLVKFISENNRSSRPLRELLTRYAQAVIDQQAPEQLSLTGAEQPGKMEILDLLIKNIDQEKELRAKPVEVVPAVDSIRAQLESAGIIKIEGPIQKMIIAGIEYILVGKYQQEGRDVALIPSSYVKPISVDGDTSALVLGLAPERDGSFVYLADGTLYNTGKVEMESAATLFQGKTGVGTTPAALNEGQMLGEVNTNTIRPLLDSLRSHAERQMKESAYNMNEVPAELQTAMKSYMNQVQSDMASTKLAAMRFGEQMRDQSLLNYQRQFGADKILNIPFPYQLWYTRTMMNWGKRMIDMPSWYAMYARWRQAQQKTEQNGIPSRLRNKMKVPAPWLPSWMGGSLYFDPLKQLFPFDQFGQAFETIRSERSRLNRQIESVLYEQVKAGIITETEKQQALATQDGTIYNQAKTAAQEQIDARFRNPFGLVSLMMTPALYYTIPKHIIQGTPEKIGVLPPTKAGMALETATEGIPVLGDIGGLIGKTMAAPEKAIRSWAGLSEFGQWGDYYIDRQLANMAAEGLITAQEAQTAMIERAGPSFDAAYQRVRQEQALNVPGVLPLFALGKGASPAQIAAALPESLFPSGILPESELLLRDEAKEYSAAWKAYRAGNSEAIDQFFEEHPEYQARLALYDEPDERLKNFLITEIWNRYGDLNKPQQNEIKAAFGDQFRTAFLARNTRSYDAIDVDTLAAWAQALGARAPKGAESLAQQPLQLGYYPESTLKIIENFEKERAKKYPNYYAMQRGYYAIPQELKTERNKYLGMFPALRLYWDWKDTQKQLHPELADYFTRMEVINNTQGATGQAEPSLPVVQPVPEGSPFQFNKPPTAVLGITVEEIYALNQNGALMRQLLGYYIAGQQISNGAKVELDRMMKGAGRDITAEEYLDQVIRVYLGY